MTNSPPTCPAVMGAVPPGPATCSIPAVGSDSELHSGPVLLQALTRVRKDLVR